MQGEPSPPIIPATNSNITENSSTTTTTTTTMTKISFSVKTKKRTELVDNSSATASASTRQFVAAREEVEAIEIAAQKRKHVTHLENGVVVAVSANDDTDGPAAKKAALSDGYLIPMRVATTDWRIRRLRQLVDEGGATDADRARLALMCEALGVAVAPTPIEKESEEEQKKMIEAEPASTVEQKKLEEPETEEADYEQMPIDAFGLAFLRGCGWKASDGIGASNKRAVALRISEPRPKGLGLGADAYYSATAGKDKDAKHKKKRRRKGEEVVIGSIVRIMSGTQRGTFGAVKSLDVDTGACFVELAVSGRMVRVGQFALEAIGRDGGDGEKNERKKAARNGSDEKKASANNGIKAEKE
jgi:hypothetical protein